MDRAPQVVVDEFERLRRLIPERPDFHLHNWGLWRRGDTLTEGYKDHSTCLENMGGCAAVESSDHLYERHYGLWAEISNVVIEGLDLRQRIILCNVYEASAFHFRKPVDEEFVAAAALFWERAERRGLV